MEYCPFLVKAALCYFLWFSVSWIPACPYTRYSVQMKLLRFDDGHRLELHMFLVGFACFRVSNNNYSCYLHIIVILDPWAGWIVCQSSPRPEEPGLKSELTSFYWNWIIWSRAQHRSPLSFLLGFGFLKKAIDLILGLNAHGSSLLSCLMLAHTSVSTGALFSSTRPICAPLFHDTIILWFLPKGSLRW